MFFKGKLKKAAVIQSFNDRKKKSSKLKKHVREQLKVVLNGANINNPTGDSLGYGE